MKVLVMTPNTLDACSFYRGAGPWMRMRHLGVDVTMGGDHSDQFQWPTLMGYDVLYIQRPYTPVHCSIIAQAKQVGVKVWIDYDDLLTQVPADNPSFYAYFEKQAQEGLRYALTQADHVSVSTEYLRKAMCERAEVIPNAFDDYLLSFEHPGERKKEIAWRGTNTHQRDLWDACPDILQIHKDNEKWSVKFIGYNPWQITVDMDPNRYSITLTSTVMGYLDYMKKSKHAIHIVPLTDCPFNRAKSNIAWMEAAYSGAIVVAPEGWEEWERPGVIGYRKGQFVQAVESAISCINRGDGPETVSEARTEIARHGLLSQANLVRKKTLERLCESS